MLGVNTSAEDAFDTHRARCTGHAFDVDSFIAGLLAPYDEETMTRLVTEVRPRLEGLVRASLFAAIAVLLLAVLLAAAGIAGSIVAVGIWGSESFGSLDPSETMRIVIPSVTAVALGAELVLERFRTTEVHEADEVEER